MAKAQVPRGKLRYKPKDGWMDGWIWQWFSEHTRSAKCSSRKTDELGFPHDIISFRDIFYSQGDTGPTGALGPRGDKGIQGDKGEKVKHLLFLVHPLWVEGFISFVSTKETLEADGTPSQIMLTKSTRVLKAKGSLITRRRQKRLERKSERRSYQRSALLAAHVC